MIKKNKHDDYKDQIPLTSGHKDQIKRHTMKQNEKEKDKQLVMWTYKNISKKITKTFHRCWRPSSLKLSLH